jgi:hypothetical protein
LTADDVDESDETSESGESEMITDVEAELHDPEVNVAKSLVKSTTTKTKPNTKVTPPEKQAKATKDIRIVTAEDDAKQYHDNKKNARVTVSTLRSYFLWYDNESLTPEAIAALLRTPPLKTNTVVSYILESIIVEKLPYSKERLRTEVLSHLAPEARLGTRYRGLVADSQESEEEL